MKLHPALKRQLVGGADLLQEVEQVANHLADLMRQIHGDDWSVHIDHDAGCYVSVARNFSAPARGKK
ncbi:hypothetical protein ASF03_21225 [Rhizobium sp. Leaf68]|nr:hypothetical protein ASE62_20680 [Rhizobium sp. Leaf202]KQN80446.1 hypothetical protein ASF03_21225 [Rhizobium sp. Leaf68]